MKSKQWWKIEFVRNAMKKPLALQRNEWKQADIKTFKDKRYSTALRRKIDRTFVVPGGLARRRSQRSKETGRRTPPSVSVVS